MSKNRRAHDPTRSASNNSVILSEVCEAKKRSKPLNFFSSHRGKRQFLSVRQQCTGTAQAGSPLDDQAGSLTYGAEHVNAANSYYNRVLASELLSLARHYFIRWTHWNAFRKSTGRERSTAGTCAFTFG